MNRKQLEHVLRAAGAITNENEILVLGSQAILGSLENPPPETLRSIEADLCPLNTPEKADLISGSIGEITYFHDTFGYYAHGLHSEACALPEGWRQRLHPYRNENTGGVTGLCLDLYDLVCAKLVAGREKDLEFATALVKSRQLVLEDVRERAADLPASEQRDRVLAACRLLAGG